MYVRPEYHTIKSRLEEPRRFIQVLMGPRQVGKSTVVRQVLGDLQLPWQMHSADYVPATSGAWICDCWAAARRLMAAKGWPCMVLVIDEIQKIANWSEAVKKEWDADTFSGTDIRLLILGSSRVMIERGLSESLAGRFEEIRMSHWGLAEMSECFGMGLDEYLFYGGYPGAAALTAQHDRFVQYIQSAIIDATINKDILVDTPVGKPALLRQTFELGAAYSGKILSLSKMVGALQDAGNTSTLAGYLTLLADSGLLCALPKHSTDMARRKASIPKLQVCNSALRTVFAQQTFHQAVADHRGWGHTFESGVGAWQASQAFVHRIELCYWRERDDEVDFVLRKNGKLVAIEVKSNAEKSTAGLAKFAQQFAPAAAFVVGEGGIPPAEFLTLPLTAFL